MKDQSLNEEDAVISNKTGLSTEVRLTGRQRNVLLAHEPTKTLERRYE